MKTNHVIYTGIDEIDYYAKLLSDTHDPIKKNVLNFHQLSYIFSKLDSFPISKIVYYDLKNEFSFENILMKYLALSYVLYRQLTKEQHHYIEYNGYFSSIIENFITRFYAFESPIKDPNQQEMLWIYPKLHYKYFLTDCIMLGNYDDYFVDISTIEEIVKIMAGFTRYELDQTLAETNYQVNFPSLIYANIKLYEKGYLEVVEENASVEIKLNLKPKPYVAPIFSRHSYALKKTIIDVCKKSYNEDYSYKDFKVF